VVLVDAQLRKLCGGPVLHMQVLVAVDARLIKIGAQALSDAITVIDSGHVQHTRGESVTRLVLVLFV
jgi:hypothetical protein